MQLAGKLVGNAKLRETQTGQKVTAFTVAMNDQFKKKDGTKVKKTTYIDCSIWNRAAITEFLTKGLVVSIVGFPTSRAYTTNEGDLRSQIEIRVDKLTFLANPYSKDEVKPTPVEQAQDTEDDLPF